MAGIANNQARENELNNFIRGEKAKAYSALTAALVAQDDLVNDLALRTYNAEQHSEAEALLIEQEISAQTRLISAAYAQVQLVGDDKVASAAFETVVQHGMATGLLVLTLHANATDRPQLVRPDSEYLDSYMDMLDCNNSTTTYIFTQLANADLGGTEVTFEPIDCASPEEFLPEGATMEFNISEE